MCDYGWTVYGTCGAHTTPVPSQRARASLVGKNPSFTSCQVDMYGDDRQNSRIIGSRSDTFKRNEIMTKSRVKT